MIAPTTNYVIQACRKDTIAYPEPMRIGEHYLIDSDSGILFVTFETFFGTPVIELVNARTMTSAGNVEAESASNLAGIILDYLDPNTVHLYTVDRGTNKLFVYDWDAQEKELELITFNGQDYYELEPKDPNMVSQVKAGGLAFDPETATLYVSQFWGGGGGFHYSQYVHAFERDPNGSYFYPRRTIDLGEDNYAVDIDVDSENGWLYAGGFNYDENSHNNLIRFDLEEENPEAETEDIGAGVIGLAVCQGTSYVYMTTYNYKLEAWDTDLPWGMGWGQIDAEDIVAGAGVCVAEVDYVEPFRLDKRDDVTDCVDPLGDGLVTYTIEPNYVWDQEGDPMLLDGVEVVDYLPEEVDFESASDGGQYEAASHTVKWVVDPNDLLDGVSFTLEVSLNRKATPWRSFTNVGEISGTISGREYSAQTSVVTNVCGCSDWEVIYVDKDAVGLDDGSSWEDAYTDLHDALAAADVCDEIWVAEGVYKVTNTAYEIEETFALVNGIAVYGGFDGSEQERNERNWWQHETVLCGDPNDDDISSGFSLLDPNYPNEDNVHYVISADEDVKWALLDGFTIRRGRYHGVFAEGSSLSVEHNKIMANGTGIYSDQSGEAVFKNNWLYGNVVGIDIEDAEAAIVVRNNTVVDNLLTGLWVDSEVEPSVKNCIFWGHSDANDVVDCFVTYCCIEQPERYYDYTDPNHPVYLGIGLGNITGDPNNPSFMDEENHDYRLSINSPCIDAGDPNDFYDDYERDIEREYRFIDGRVDMGADEYCGLEASPADFNEDGIVNMVDFALFAPAWLSDPNDTNWQNGTYDLDEDGEIVDLADLKLLMEDWLATDCLWMGPTPLASGVDMSMTMKSTIIEMEPLLLESKPISLEELKELIEWLNKIWAEEKELRDNVKKQEWIEFLENIIEYVLKENE